MKNSSSTASQAALHIYFPHPRRTIVLPFLLSALMCGTVSAKPGKGKKERPEPPQAVGLQVASATSVTARWSDPENDPTDTTYEVLVSPSPSPSTDRSAPDYVRRTKSTAVTIGSLAPSTRYYGEVRAVNDDSGRASSYINLGTVQTAAAPGGIPGPPTPAPTPTPTPAPTPAPVEPAPTLTSNAPGAQPFSAVSNSQVQAHWDAAGNPPGTEYRVILSPSPSPSTNGVATNQTVDTTNLSHAFTGLSPNTLYYADVRATAPLATASAFTSLGSAATLANPPSPLAPTSVQPTAFTANWGNNSNPAGTPYTAQISQDSAFGTIAGAQTTTGTSATFSGLTADTTYYARVAAANSAGTQTEFVALPSVFTPPTLLQTSSLSGSAASPTSIVWTWTPAVNATGYRIINPSGDNLSGNLSPETLTFTESGLIVNTPYTRSVVSLSGGAGAISSPLTRYTLSNPPANLQLTGVGFSSMTITWNTNGNPDYTGYQVNYWEVGGATTTLVVNAGQALLSSLSTGTTYFLEVRALNGDSVVSAPAPAAGDGSTLLSAVTLGARATFSAGAVKVRPNPFRPSRGDTEIIFDNVPAGAHIRIYTITGEKIADLRNDAGSTVRWDAKNQSGQAVASGIYYALTDAEGDRKTIKVAIQR
jgi:hypothetical protein